MAKQFNSDDQKHRSTDSDAALMELVEQGQQEALATLFQRYSGLVYAIALRVLADPAAAEDVMQEIFLQIWRNPKGYASKRGELRGWLAVIARNRAIDVIRRRRQTASIDDTVLAAPGALEDEASNRLLLEKVKELVATLPDEQRHTLELAFFEGCSHAAIAERLNHPLGTVKSRIRAAVQKLEEAFAR